MLDSMARQGYEIVPTRPKPRDVRAESLALGCPNCGHSAKAHFPACLADMGSDAKVIRLCGCPGHFAWAHGRYASGQPYRDERLR